MVSSYNEITLGGPASPEVELTAVSSSTIRLSWPQPFSWPEYPLAQYEIESNHSQYFTPEEELPFMDQARREVDITKVDELEECQAIEFSVRANNALADSETATIIGGFPIGEQITFE